MFIQKLKTHFRPLLLIIIFIVFLLLLLFYPAKDTNKKEIFQSYRVVSGFPIRLTIPAININADIQHLGVTQAGEMEVPNNNIDVGWFDLGPRPGERGDAVIAGHFNGKNGKVGVFAKLDKLKMGDMLFVKDDKGKTTAFVVRESRTYDPGYANDVFNSNDGVHLNLITCDGVWDETKNSYSKRLVVFSDAVK